MKKVHPGPTVAEPGSKEAETWHKLVGIVRIQYKPGHWVYDGGTKRNIWIEGFFYAYIDYGITSEWRGQ